MVTYRTYRRTRRTDMQPAPDPAAVDTAGGGDSDSWWNHAACIGVDPETFSPLSLRGRVARAALALCDTCPVRQACRDDMLMVAGGPKDIIAGGWYWDTRGRAVPHPHDAARRDELVAAALARIRIQGLPWPFILNRLSHREKTHCG